MKRKAAILAMVLLIGACEAPKPWSPYDDTKKDGQETTSSDAPLPKTTVGIDIGDAEQGIFVEAKIAPESLTADIKAEELQDFRKHATKLTVDVTPPAPAEFWIDYTVRCSRDFKECPVVLRSEIKVEGQTVDTIVAVLGANAQKNTYSKKVNLLKNLPTPPATILAAVTGALLLMPEGTAEGSVNPETAQSNVSSPAVQATTVRVNFGPAGDAAAGAAPAAATAEAPATVPAETAAPAPAPAPAPAEAPAPAPASTVQ